MDNKELMTMIASNIKHGGLNQKLKPSTVSKMKQVLAFKQS